MVRDMELKEQVIENSTEIKMVDIRLDALINLLSKEGIITHNEVKDEINKILQKKKKDG